MFEPELELGNEEEKIGGYCDMKMKNEWSDEMRFE